jgi:transposase-like protein
VLLHEPTLNSACEPKKKTFSTQERMDIVAQIDANKETHVALAGRLGSVPSTLNNIVKNRNDTENCFAKVKQVFW